MRRLPFFFWLFIVLLSSACARSGPLILESTHASPTLETEAVSGTWPLKAAPAENEFVLPLHSAESVAVTLRSDLGVVQFQIVEGTRQEVTVRLPDQSYYLRVVGRRAMPSASFSPVYQEQHRGGVTVEVPEVYELVNIAFALASEDPALTLLQPHSHVGDYWQAVQAWFSEHRQHPFALDMLETTRANLSFYFAGKNDAYAFAFDADGIIRPSTVYDRIDPGGVRPNALQDRLSGLQAFAEASNFRTFYRQQQAAYDRWIQAYQEELQVSAMMDWLRREFPQVQVDGAKVIFSPLVGGIQNSVTLKNDGYTELQAHVNAPDLLADAEALGPGWTRAGFNKLDSNLVFTEFNHGFINPSAEAYVEAINRAVRTLPYWANERALEWYGSPESLWLEYLNWGLTLLWSADSLAADDLERLRAYLSNNMVNVRGFLQFDAYSHALLELYRQRPEGVTVAALYPQMIQWFAERDPAGDQE